MDKQQNIEARRGEAERPPDNLINPGRAITTQTAT
jgi:hypothetical protein